MHIEDLEHHLLVRVLEEVVVAHQHGERLRGHVVEECQCATRGFIVSTISSRAFGNVVERDVVHCEVCARVTCPRHRNRRIRILAIALGNGVVFSDECKRTTVAIVGDLDSCGVVFANNQRVSGDTIRISPSVEHVVQRQFECLVGILVQLVVVDGHHNGLFLNARQERQRALRVIVIVHVNFIIPTRRQLGGSAIVSDVIDSDVPVPRCTARDRNRAADHVFTLLVLHVFEIQCACIAVILNHDLG